MSLQSAVSDLLDHLHQQLHSNDVDAELMQQRVDRLCKLWNMLDDEARDLVQMAQLRLEQLWKS